MTDHTRRAVRTRLRRIAGQVAGIERMIDDDRYCVDVLLQIAAAQAALDRAGKVVLEAHVESCVSGALAGGSARARRKKIDELMEVFRRFGQIRAR
jgi:DNA-binding FrmR family transcriptional regulator